MITVRVQALLKFVAEQQAIKVQFDAQWDGTSDGLAKIIELVRQTLTRADVANVRAGGRGVKLAEPVRIDPVPEVDP